jgi:hypothetical protein
MIKKYILGFFLICIIIYILNNKIEGFQQNGTNFLGDIDETGEKLPLDYEIKEKQCREIKTCDQVKLFPHCGYCLSDDVNVDKEAAFHYGDKGGTYTKNSYCYAPGYSGLIDEDKKRNLEWVPPGDAGGNLDLSVKKCREIKTKHVCESQTQCSIMKGMELNIDKENACGWCQDETEQGGTSYVRSYHENDIGNIKGNAIGKNTGSMLVDNYYCSNNDDRTLGGNEMDKIDMVDNLKNCIGVKKEKTEWDFDRNNDVKFEPQYKSKNGKCNKDLIKNSDCNIFNPESCMKITFDESGNQIPGPFIENPLGCIETLWNQIGYSEDTWTDFTEGKYNGEEDIEVSNEINSLKLDVSGNFNTIRKRLETLAREKIHSGDFAVSKKWNKILLNKGVCENYKPSATQDFSCVNPCYKNANTSPPTEWETTPGECMVKLFKEQNGTKNGYVHPNNSGKIRDILQPIQAAIFPTIETFGILKHGTVENESIRDPLDIFSTYKVSDLKNYGVDEIKGLYTKIKDTSTKPDGTVLFSEKYRANMQLTGNAPATFKMKDKPCWVDFVKIMLTYPGTKTENYKWILIDENAKNDLETKIAHSSYMECNKIKGRVGEQTFSISTTENCEKVKQNVINEYLTYLEFDNSSYKLKKETYEKPGFDFKNWLNVLNDYWKQNWKKFLYLMSQQDKVTIMENRIEIDEYSPFYNLISSKCEFVEADKIKYLEYKSDTVGKIYLRRVDDQQTINMKHESRRFKIAESFHNSSITIIPEIKPKKRISMTAKIIMIKDKRYETDTKTYRMNKTCDNIWNNCKLDTINLNDITKETTEKKKYLMEKHLQKIEFYKFFSLMDDAIFLNIVDYNAQILPTEPITSIPIYKLKIDFFCNFVKSKSNAHLASVVPKLHIGDKQFTLNKGLINTHIISDISEPIIISYECPINYTLNLSRASVYLTKDNNKYTSNGFERASEFFLPNVSISGKKSDLFYLDKKIEWIKINKGVVQQKMNYKIVVNAKVKDQGHGSSGSRIKFNGENMGNKNNWNKDRKNWKTYRTEKPFDIHTTSNMRLEHYTPHSGNHETYIKNASFSLFDGGDTPFYSKNLPSVNINADFGKIIGYADTILWEGFKGVTEGFKGVTEGFKGVIEGFKEGMSQDAKDAIDAKPDNPKTACGSKKSCFTYKAKDQGWGTSGSNISVNGQTNSIGKRWKKNKIPLNIDKHNQMLNIKVYTPPYPGHETQIRGPPKIAIYDDNGKLVLHKQLKDINTKVLNGGGGVDVLY